MDKQALVDESDVRVTAAIVTYCSRTELPDCLDSLSRSAMPVKAVVIDNASSDNTLGLAESYAARDKNVVAVASGGNIGLAAANNLIIPYVTGGYVLILNPDTVVERDAISTMVDILDRRKDVGAVGPKCVYENGDPHTSYHLGWGYWHLILWRLLPYSIVRGLYDKFARYKEGEVGFVSGACLLVRAEAFKAIGGYDPAYFLTVEDACDLCERLRDYGYITWFTPRAQIKHLCGRSGEHVPYLTTLEGYKGDIYHFRKHRGGLGGWLAYLIVLFSCAVKVLISWAKMLARRRPIDHQNFGVYWKIFPRLLSEGPGIADSNER